MTRWWIIPDDRSTRKSQWETNLQSDSRPYLDGFTYNGSTYEGQAKCFSSRSLLGLPRLSNKCVTDQFRTALTRRLKELSLSLVASIINPAKREWRRCTRPLSLRCTRLPSLRCMRPLSLRCALSLQRLLPLSPGEHQAYETYYLYFKKPPRSYKLPHQVELIQGGSTTKKAFVWASIFWISFLGSH